MKKYIILSVNDNAKYMFYIPLVCWGWRKIGWEPAMFYHGEHLSPLYMEATECLDTGNHQSIFLLNNITGFQPETITQCSRLYGACLLDGYLMTSDIDMLPLSDYWKLDTDKLTVWGRDLTDYHYPICYIGMDSEKWKEVMHIDGNDYQYYMQRDLMEMPQAKSADKIKRWVTDQDLITERINTSSFIPERVDRGTYKNGYPIGRVDRSAWTLKHDVFIDAHLPHDILINDGSFRKVMELLHTVWPAEDWKWFVNYYKEFKKLIDV